MRVWKRRFQMRARSVSYLIKAALGLGKLLVPRQEVIHSQHAWWARWSCGSDGKGHSDVVSQSWETKPGMENISSQLTLGCGKTRENPHLGNGRGPMHLPQGKWTLKLGVLGMSCPESFWEIKVILIEMRCQEATGLSLFLWDGTARAHFSERAF